MFAGLAPLNEPEIVIAVIVENEARGETASPIANNAEYLRGSILVQTRRAQNIQ